MERNDAIKRIKSALKKRTGKMWSVTGGSGTAYGWITIKATPKQSTDGFGTMTEEQQLELAKALGFEVGKDVHRHVHHQGVSIPASSDYREEYVARAEGRPPTTFGKVYWD